MATDSTVGIDMYTRTLEAIRHLIRQELRRVGLRPPTPQGPGAWRWDATADAWVAVPPPDAPARPPAHESA